MVYFIFDFCVNPLAVCLILAYNIAVYRKDNESVYDKNVVDNTPLQVKNEPESIALPVPSQPKIEPVPEPKVEPKVEKVEEKKPNSQPMAAWYRQMFKI